MRLLLLPGLDGTGDLFDPLIASLTMPTTVVRYPLEECLTYDELFHRVVAELPEEPVVVVAESFSGPLAVRLAAEPRVVGVVLASGFASRPRPIPTWLVQMMAPPLLFFAPPKFVVRSLLLDLEAPPELVELLRAALRRVKTAVLVHRLVEVLRVDVRALLRSSEVPLLYLVAQEDRLVPNKVSRELAVLRSDAQMEVISAPHLLLQCAPVEAAAAITRFVE